LALRAVREAKAAAHSAVLHDAIKTALSVLAPAAPTFVPDHEKKRPEMITLRRSADRGHADHGWLKSYHSFSFADYYDPAHMGFSNLRVINEDRIAPGSGFGAHAHRDMEIISYVLDGALGHKDSIGNGATIVPGEVQRMSAGTGIRHSENNAAKGRTTHFLQIWIEPSAHGIAPGYEQKAFDERDKRGRLRLVASQDGRDGSVVIHADASMYAGLFDGDESAALALPTGRRAYVHVVRGTVEINGQPVRGGDALMLEDEKSVELRDGRNAEVLVFELP
jgi:quercetin 2,3-dioxygenase